MDPITRKTYVDPVQEAMGNMGPWQIVISIAISLINFPVAWHQLSLTFLAPKTDFTCLFPIPLNNRSTFNQCYINIDNNVTGKCTKFRYDKKIFYETIITKWDLVCDKDQYANYVQSSIMFGILVGNFVFSLMADRIGRKNPLIIAIVLQSMTGLMSAFVPWYELFLLFKFISAVATGGTMLVSFVLLMEIVGMEWRSTISVLFHIPFLLGYLMNPLISYLTRRWYTFQIAISIPPIMFLSYYWIIPESPKWLLAVGQVSEAEEIITQAARRNRIPAENVKIAIESHERDLKLTRDGNRNKFGATYLFRTPNIRLKSICICINWFVCGSCFFGLAQYIGDLDGNIFLNVAASASVQFPGILVVLCLISRVSRLKILIGGHLLSGLSLLSIILVNNPTIRVYLAILGFGGISITFPTVYLYSSEVFPTVVRNAGVGLGSVCAKIGSTIVPYLATMGKTESTLPPIIFGIGSLVGAGLCFWLPETMNCELPETIEDGENFGKKSTLESGRQQRSKTVQCG